MAIYADHRPPDSELAIEAANGSRPAFDAIVQRYRHRLFRFLRMRARSQEDAEELLQESLLRCWTRLGSYDPEREFATWLFTLAARLAVSHGRRPVLPGAAEHELEQAVAAAADPAEEVERDDSHRNLWDVALRVLSPDARTTMWLFYVEQRASSEIARILGKRDEAVRAMLSRARERLAAHLPHPTTTCRRR